MKVNLLRQNGGNATIQFAIVAPVFFLVIFGVVEFGLYMYHRIAVERIAVNISRVASIGKTADPTGVCSGTTNQLDYIKCIAKRDASGLINGDKLEVQMKVVNASSNTPPDVCLDNPAAPSSAPNTCTVYDDINGDGVYNGAGASNAGARSEVVEVRIIYPWIVQMPLVKDFFGKKNKGIQTVSASTVIRNEPL